MTQKRSRTGLLIGIAAGVSAAAAMLSATAAPTARADDFTDVINAVDGDLTGGQAAFSLADTYLGSGDLTDGLANFFDGVNDDFLSAPNQLLGDTAQLLDNDPLRGSILWSLNFIPPTDLTEALNNAAADFNVGETLVEQAATYFGSGDYGDAALDDLFAPDYFSIIPLEEVLLGAVASF
jgi:hypothetical protein